MRKAVEDARRRTRGQSPNASLEIRAREDGLLLVYVKPLDALVYSRAVKRRRRISLLRVTMYSTVAVAALACAYNSYSDGKLARDLYYYARFFVPSSILDPFETLLTLTPEVFDK